MKAQLILELLEKNDLELLRKLAESEALEQFKKQDVNSKLLKVVKKMMKCKYLISSSVGYTLYEDKYYFTDGRRILESNSNLGFTQSKRQLGIEKVTKKFEGTTAEVDILELQKIIRENKEIEKENKRIKKLYKGTFEEEKPYLPKKYFIVNDEIVFDPVYLIEMIEATGTNIIHYDNPLRACYFGDNYRNILLPVRRK